MRNTRRQLGADWEQNTAQFGGEVALESKVRQPPSLSAPNSLCALFYGKICFLPSPLTPLRSFLPPSPPQCGAYTHPRAGVRWCWKFARHASVLCVLVLLLSDVWAIADAMPIMCYGISRMLLTPHGFADPRGPRMHLHHVCYAFLALSAALISYCR